MIPAALAGPLMASLIGVGGAAAINEASEIGDKKVPGIPTPSGADMGQNALDYYQTAFPDTTQWERLGHNPGMAQVASAEVGANSASRLQKNELRARANIADDTNLAHVIAAGAPSGPAAVNDLVQAYKSKGFAPGSTFDTKTQIDRDSLNIEKNRIREQVKNLIQERRGITLDNVIKQVEASYAEKNASTELIAARVKIATDAFNSMAHGAIGAGMLGYKPFNAGRNIGMSIPSAVGKKPTTKYKLRNDDWRRRT